MGSTGAMGGGPASNTTVVEALFNHLVLPPMLPERPEFMSDDGRLPDALSSLLIRACKSLQHINPGVLGPVSAWKAIEKTISSSRALRDDNLGRQILISAFHDLAHYDDAAWLALHVVEQNAGLLIHRDSSNSTIVFEAFEMAAIPSKVLEATHALSWSFPARVVAVPIDIFEDISFTDNLANFLEQAGTETFERFAAKAQKGGALVTESRVASRPDLICQMLMSLLEGFGNATAVQQITKKVRDDVVLSSSQSEKPWRRSPDWLLMRVALSRQLATLYAPIEPGIHRVPYKFLICAALALFLKESVGVLRPENVCMLRAKLCRRLAKLEEERSSAKGVLRAAFDAFFDDSSEFFAAAVKEVTEQVTRAWTDYKFNTTRRIPPLPRRAQVNDTKLFLTNSGPKLMDLLLQKAVPSTRRVSPEIPVFAEGTISQVNRLAQQHARLFDHEQSVIVDGLGIDWENPEQSCTTLSKLMIQHQDMAGTVFQGDALLMSRHLLVLFSLWVGLDLAATTSCRLLLNYHPGFVPESLDVLCLPTLSEMERLRKVQEYLADRVKNSNPACGSIFDHPRRSNAFPVEFVRTTSDGAGIDLVGVGIDEKSDNAKESKKAQLRALMDEYEDLTEAIRSGVCICVRMRDGTMDIRGCQKCFAMRRRRRLSIPVHEDFLPSSSTDPGDIHRAAILFELHMPAYLRDYRSATWMLKMLGSAVQPNTTTTPALLLENLEVLSKRAPQVAFSSSLTLASRNKSFVQTHYKELKLPKRLEEVLLPFGANFAYYDHTRQAWAEDIPSVPWFETLLGQWVPKGLPNPYEVADNYINAETFQPSSYSIVARATHRDRPDDMSVHELSALQRILSSRGRRWLELLTELGSCNINYSSSVVAALLNHVAIQAGPSTLAPDVLREAHVIFRDEVFCGRLSEQLSARLNPLAASSWREVHYLSIIVTLALRLYFLCPPSIKAEARHLLERIREVTSNWIKSLRKVLRSTTDAGAAQKAATFAFWSALLCHQTFSIFCVNDGEETPESPDILNVQCFFRASIALQENILVDLDQLDIGLKQLLVRDLITTYGMREVIQQWMKDHPLALEAAISETWSDVGGASQRRYTSWVRASGHNGWWFMTQTLKTKNRAAQYIHFHLLEGHLLVDGKPLGRLPLEMTDDDGVRELFGKQHLLTRPSSLNGMQYQLTNSISSHEVHFGTSGGRVIIRAMLKGSLWEYVPRAVFKGESGQSDLPANLVDDCVHWLNTYTGELHCRRKPKIWLSERKSNWVLDVRARTAVRGKEASRPGLQGGSHAKSLRQKGTYLVEPRSRLGQDITSVFRGFEDPDKLTIYQPPGTGLSVEMKRLEIRFTVNPQKVLYCPQLKAEVDPNQDPGTLYGLASKLVMRNESNHLRRSILVPRGTFFWERSGMHVKVSIANQGTYARFMIDSILGRLTCAPEPRLLYMKAALHALTSFPIPDPLTHRTGSEEAEGCLRAASSQHWDFLDAVSLDMLSLIRSLAPERSYYPPGQKLYQKVKWNDGLTMSIQHEGLVPIVDIIRQESEKLQALQPPQPGSKHISPATTVFPATSIEHTETCDCDACHLRCRGRLRRQLYERLPEGPSLVEKRSRATAFIPRDREFQCQHSTQVYRIIQSLVLGRLDETQLEIPHATPLSSLLKGVENIGGFLETQSSVPLDIQMTLDSDLRESWGSYVQTCRLSGIDNQYDVAFLLGLLAFGQRTDMRLLRWLLYLACKPSLQAIDPPQHPSFADFQPFERPQKEVLVNLILSNQASHTGKKIKKGRHQNVDATHNDGDKYEAEKTADILVQQWPDTPQSVADLEESVEHLEFESINLRRTWKMLNNQLLRLSHNHDLSTYLSLLEGMAKTMMQSSDAPRVAITQIWRRSPQALLGLDPETEREAPFSVPQLADHLALKPCNSSDQPTTEESAEEPPRPVQLATTQAPTGTMIHGSQSLVWHPPASLPRQIEALSKIVDDFTNSSNSTRSEYGTDLQKSLDALIEEHMKPRPAEAILDEEKATLGVARARSTLATHFKMIHEALCRGETGRSWLSSGGLLPCISPVTILMLLRQHQKLSISHGMRNAIVQYGVMVTQLQRFLRLRDALLCKDKKRAVDEQRQEGHLNWEPADHPDWLLIEIDSDMLIREVQVDVARAIISPSSQQNSVLQMNMGQGKTSCIVPMAMTALADRTKLCRLIVPAPLLIQTAQVLQTRLGGLVGRVVRHVPFARRTPATPALLRAYEGVHHQVLETGGVMLCLPEHIMSFKLSGHQKLVDGKDDDSARKMIELQNWFERSCRDVIDESDYTLSAKTQLIYPNGSQSAVDGHPFRWQAVEDLLSLTERHAGTLESRFPKGIQITRRHRGYPILHFLNADVEDALINLLIDDICDGRFPLIRLKDLRLSSMRESLRLIVCGDDVNESTWSCVAQALGDDANASTKMLCLARGLLSQRILLLCLKKRWNVQYGLHPGRAPIAVPFEAKGVPSQTAEYGHPDTALVLTCLAFYQTGLTKGQIRQSLQHVMRSDDPASHYEIWIQGCNSLPHHLRGWNQVNADDEAQVEELWTHLRFDRSVVNNFMNTFVFPAHAKQFETKLQASGWDIPLLCSDTTIDGHKTIPDERQSLTTGFSGTNDNKRILPKTIKQNDLASLTQTNAEVLSYLLEFRNQKCILAQRHIVRHGLRHGVRWSEHELLEALKKSGPGNSPIRVLIDAGAYILEMENAALADAWLAADPDAQGAVYFDHDGRIMVRARFQKMALPLLASPFADNLEACVVYIDEAHTRGTDLKLPPKAMGAVTLGLGQTKDKTVQAAMRLRQLGSSQSVAFIAPPEVYQSIVDLQPPHKGKKTPAVTSVDVVRWLLEQSCKANENMLPLYVAQGMDFCRRTNALWKNPNLASDAEATARVLAVLQQREEQTLEALYGTIQSTTHKTGHFRTKIPLLKEYAAQLGQEKLTGSKHSSAFEEVEQEREVEFEVEQVRETQRSAGVQPRKFPGLSDALQNFVKTGIFDESNGDFIQAFDHIGATTIGKKYGVRGTASKLFVTAEFCHIVSAETVSQDGGKKKKKERKAQDLVEAKKGTEWSMVRPVQWVLWHSKSQTAVVVIPEEAEILLPILRSSTGVQLLIYAAPVTKSMTIFNSLKYYTVPASKKRTLPVWLRLEIGILAGRLYFGFDEYEPLLTWLGLESRSQSDTASSDGETSEVSDGLRIEEPLSFLMEWLTHHRQTDDISHTPMGFICQRRTLHRDHAFFSALTVLHETSSEDELTGGKNTTSGATEDEDDLSDTSEEDMMMSHDDLGDDDDLEDDVDGLEDGTDGIHDDACEPRVDKGEDVLGELETLDLDD